MKFNVHQWSGQQWFYIATCKAKTEREAIEIAIQRFGLNNRYQAYPHIDNFTEVK